MGADSLFWCSFDAGISVTVVMQHLSAQLRLLRLGSLVFDWALGPTAVASQAVLAVLTVLATLVSVWQGRPGPAVGRGVGLPRLPRRRTKS